MCPSAMFESWRGRYADSPKAVSEQLALRSPDIKQYWVASDGAALPDYCLPLRRHSPAYFLQLLRSDYLFTNDIVTKHLVKGRNVRYIQSWHGTPLKRIGFDETQATYSGAAKHRQRMIRDVSKWDYLVSPSPECSSLFRSAFRYEGEILETGYPRNDILNSDSSSALRKTVRGALGILPGEHVVLYAPTWRDDSKAENGRFQDTSNINYERLATYTPEGTVFLSRMHSVVEAHRPKGPSGHLKVLDVSGYPDIAELYLAADVLVSDYSSAIYDFAVTGKPIILYAYDLLEYSTSVRGLYFDYAEWAPGPIVTSLEELGSAISNSELFRVTLQPRYRSFQQRFCPWEDGKATQRLLDALLS
ncbi:CDP-glycerol glycerophosphotransferase family protein [Paeniglutamicibacter cryotolerans]|uniref:CDP-glycerol glycerophosphotransferase n=1 Tax=Paeniglutamicibacter cryotolerans TaxID=670079 RepID=A0A839QHX6_9MICC|nr:CDP-glycerol glycerophosphotransferase family protein [Paeniglutamicibacter cryotolerans]MBB2995988.1 CDP-glycerol glycerophosphotransferase [Paeniglutamicibacter cryotolerans]